ncbi:MAG: carboxypeptidase regulatory-like domain-containing protein, partial [Thermoplasmata archaeon]
ASENSYASGYSDASGNYQISSGLDNGIYTIMVSKPGYISSFVQNVSITSGGTTTQNIVLTPSAILQGYVKDNVGLPVVGATVRALNETLEHGFGMAFSNATGFYKIDGTTIGGLETGVYTVYGEADGYITRIYENVLITTGTPNNLNLVLNRSVKFVGKVTNINGEGVKDAIVSFVGENVESAGQGLTDSNGDYSICKNLLGGTYTLTVRASGYPTYTRSGIDAETGETVTVNVQLGATGSISGFVKDLAGNPIQNVYVKAVSVSTTVTSSALTQTDGSYQITSLAEGSYDITFNAATQGFQTLTVENIFVLGGNVTWVNQTLTKPTFAIGRIIDEAGHPVRAYVNLTGDYSYSIVSESDGRYNITVFPGTYSVSVEAQDYVYSYYSPFEVYEGFANELNFTLKPFLKITKPANGQKVTNRTVTVSGITVPGAKVTISVNGIEAVSTVASVLGEFTQNIVVNTGNWEISVFSYDETTGQYSTKSVTITYSLPRITIKSPVNETTINTSRILIKGEAYDSSGGDNLLVYVKIDDGNWELAEGVRSWSKVWIVTSENNGAHTVQAKAFESESLVSIVSVHFYINLPLNIVGLVVKQPENMTGVPGGSVTYRFQVRNTGTFTDSFDITATSEKGWKVTLSQEKIENLPKLNGQKDVLVTVKIPSDAKAGIKDILTFTVTSRTNSETKASVSVETTVKENTVPGAMPPYLIPLMIFIICVVSLIGILAYRNYLKHVKMENERDKRNEL